MARVFLDPAFKAEIAFSWGHDYSRQLKDVATVSRGEGFVFVF